MPAHSLHFSKAPRGPSGLTSPSDGRVAINSTICLLNICTAEGFWNLIQAKTLKTTVSVPAKFNTISVNVCFFTTLSMLVIFNAEVDSKIHQSLTRIVLVVDFGFYDPLNISG